MASTTKTAVDPTWTPADEAAFQEMQQRREAVVGEREKRLQAIANDVWIAIINRGPDTLTQADRGRCYTATMEALRLFAYSVREALEPFDGGPPIAEAPPAV